MPPELLCRCRTLYSRRCRRRRRRCRPCWMCEWVINITSRYAVVSLLCVFNEIKIFRPCNVNRQLARNTRFLRLGVHFAVHFFFFFFIAVLRCHSLLIDDMLVFFSLSRRTVNLSISCESIAPQYYQLPYIDSKDLHQANCGLIFPFFFLFRICRCPPEHNCRWHLKRR